MDLQSDALPPELSDHPHTYTHTYIHTHIYIYIHTHTHIHIFLSAIKEPTSRMSKDLIEERKKGKIAYFVMDQLVVRDKVKEEPRDLESNGTGISSDGEVFVYPRVRR